MTDGTQASIWVVIPAAGVGKRMRSDIPKQYIPIHGKTVIEHTLDCFLSYSAVKGIVIALHPEDPYWKNISAKMPTDIPVYTVEGGRERSHSVLQALEYLACVEKLDSCQWVMVHDAARPCLSQKDINALHAVAGRNSVGGILATPVKDTMKRASKGTHVIAETENREDLWHALTPQMFHLEQLRKALQRGIESNRNITDEASAMEMMGVCPELVEGSSQNIKITHPDDIAYAGWLLKGALD